jgi:hypothetical protein
MKYLLENLKTLAHTTIHILNRSGKRVNYGIFYMQY